MQHKQFDTPILCIFNLYSRNNDEYGQNNTISFELAYLQKYIVRCYGNIHVLIFSEYGLLAAIAGKKARFFINGTFSLRQEHRNNRQLSNIELSNNSMGKSNQMTNYKKIL